MMVGVSDTDFELPEQAPTESPEPDVAPVKKRARKRNAPAPARRRRLSPDALRKKREGARAAIEAHQKILGTGAPVRAVMSTLLDCPNDPIDIAVASVSASGADVSSVSTLLELREMDDDLSAVVTAASLAENRRVLATLWSLAQSVGGTSSGLPAHMGVTQAAASLVRMVRELDDEAVATLSSAVTHLS